MILSVNIKHVLKKRLWVLFILNVKIYGVVINNVGSLIKIIFVQSKVRTSNPSGTPTVDLGYYLVSRGQRTGIK